MVKLLAISDKLSFMLKASKGLNELALNEFNELMK